MQSLSSAFIRVTMLINSHIDIPLPVTHRCPAMRSRLSPWLTPLIYGLGKKVVLPTYFSKIEVTGQKNIPTSGPVVLAPTHQARWDPLLVGLIGKRAGRYSRFMVTADECLGIQGWFARRVGGFPINVRKPSIKSLRHGVQLLREKEMLVIYPEGDIYRHYLNPLKPGLARIALGAERGGANLGVKIIPIGIEYSERYPQWRGSVEIRIGEPISVAEYTAGEYKAQSQRLTKDLHTALMTLSAKAPAPAPIGLSALCAR